MWGPNAVNGVINIITKRTSDTQGVFVRGVTGSRERGHAIARYGGTINSGATYRLYGVGSRFDSPQLQDGTSAREDRRLRQAGGRVDWNLDGQARLTVHGDVNSARMGLSDSPDIQMDGGNVVITFNKPFRGESFHILGYVDREHRDVPQQSWESRTTYNAKRRRGFGWRPGTVSSLAAAVRSTLSHTRPTTLIFFDPDDRRINQSSRIRADGNHSHTEGLGDRRHAGRAKTSAASICSQRSARNIRLARMRCDWGAHFPRHSYTHALDQDLRVTIGDTVVIRGDRGFKPERLTAFETGRGSAPYEGLVGSVGLLQRLRRPAEPGSDITHYAGESVRRPCDGH